MSRTILLRSFERLLTCEVVPFVLAQQRLGWTGLLIEDIGGRDEATMAWLALGLILSGAL